MVIIAYHTCDCSGVLVDILKVPDLVTATIVFGVDPYTGLDYIRSAHFGGELRRKIRSVSWVVADARSYTPSASSSRTYGCYLSVSHWDEGGLCTGFGSDPYCESTSGDQDRCYNLEDVNTVSLD